MCQKNDETIRPLFSSRVLLFFFLLFLIYVYEEKKNSEEVLVKGKKNNLKSRENRTGLQPRYTRHFN